MCVCVSVCVNSGTVSHILSDICSEVGVAVEGGDGHAPLFKSRI